jgi:plastocyanin
MIAKAFLAIVLTFGVAAPEARAQSPAGTTYRIDIKSFAFVPARVELRAGDTIVWTNTDLAPHTATADGGEWTSGEIKNGAEGRYTPTAPGTFAYHCKYHPQMKGVIVVAPSP